MNTFQKFCPNVWVAKCETQHEKGDVIEVTNRYGDAKEHIVFNLVGRSPDGLFYFYSIVRADGWNVQERAKAKADRINGWATNAEKRSDAAYEASQEGRDFLSLGEPIKVGHHSEKRHRALIERNWNRMGKSVAESKKAAEYAARADYWERQATVINLSMPDSLEYYEFKLEQATAKHEGLKNGTIEREHSYSLTYAKKEVNEAQKNVELAKRLWV